MQLMNIAKLHQNFAQTHRHITYHETIFIADRITWTKDDKTRYGLESGHFECTTL